MSVFMEEERINVYIMDFQEPWTETTLKLQEEPVL